MPDMPELTNREPDGTPERPDPDRARAALARKWAYLLSGVVVLPLTSHDLGQELRGLLDALCAALLAEPPTRAAEEVGERLAALGYLGEAGLRCTTEVLGKGLLALPEFQPVERFAARVLVGMGALTTGYLAADRRALLAQQEHMHLTLLKAVRDAKWHLKESEARFAEVSTLSANGIMIVGLDGRLIQANAAIGEILDYSPAELTGTSLYDLVHPDSAASLREGVLALLDGKRDRIRQSQSLLRKDGEVARISLTASVLPGADNRPSHLVAVVEDGTELMLLQGELRRQALHDVLTGLPNRQFFGTHLESVLRRVDPAYGITLFQLDIDAFGLVCHSLGRRAGERLLVHVAQQLRAVLADETAMVARFDGDEFGVVLENSATTPAVETIVAAINRELAGPFYVDGVGLSAVASVGVVHRPSGDLDPAELLRAADAALRRAKNGRRGQWELFHPDQDARDRRAAALAVGMPGAFEQGEISVRYRPVVHLADGTVAGVEALLRWDRPDADPVPHDACLDLAERTGLTLPLGEWLLRVAGGQVQWWRQRGFDVPLAVGITAYQAADADLVSRVVRVLGDTGLLPNQVVLGVPVRALAVPEAAENLTVLHDMGIGTALDDFDFGPDAMAAVEDLPVCCVRVASRVVRRQATTGGAVVGALLPIVLGAGATVIVDGVATDTEAAWWRAAGASTATGEHFGSACPPGDILARFASD
ncbi:EAL domain-containing protein [Actinokineospora iranica]|uniref:PAS domain S-box-containing protein/diguanylate cyclase (GGDEF) domain-containing protein n=1 Tax=Actinokineospora iranica TaxID=1271860 RepID=A0A1G6S4K5_9PSEU|nr:EAL domain-containing protein [Actinokineospora iranica]SDD11125.1 PAS domain S-box-containing protein/diguanylate cyclase (GGDEF) domain-containing protein [Actinokineospora iranica]